MISIEGFVAEQLATWEVPGCAVAAIHDGEVVVDAGFGTRELGRALPVSSRTLFPIGSITKSFTAAGVAALVDDGVLEWERPIRAYLPGFAMHDPVATERLTVLDLLSHRSGLPRHEFAWLAHPDRSRADIAGRLRFLQPSKDIRQAFQYCNLGYMTVGHLVEELTGSSWEDLTASRLLKPLGMERTNFSVSDVRRSDDFAKPHELRGGTVVEIPFREFDRVGPAGSINSCADDMLAWLRVNLGLAQDVVSSGTLALVHAPHITHPEDRTFAESTRFGYGMGWRIGQYRGHRIVEHSGGVDGFLADCMVLPDDGIGVVVLTNCWSGIGPAIAYRIFDDLLGLSPIDWPGRLKPQFDALMAGAQQAATELPKVENAPLLRPLEAYVGDYQHPGYGTLSVTVEEDSLRPRFGTMELSMTHRHYDVFDLEWHELVNQHVRFPLTFLTAPDGSVDALTVPFEDQVPPIRFERRPQTPEPGVLASLVGTYEMGAIALEIARKSDDRLTVTAAGSPAAELVPIRELLFGVAEQPGLTLEFVLDEGGRVSKLVAQPLGVFKPRN